MTKKEAPRKGKEKPAGEWQTKVIATWKQSKSSVWRAQVSTSPDGKKFTGVRQFHIKADGTEMPGRGGISFINDPKTLPTSLDEMIRLFTALKGDKRDKIANVVSGDDAPVKKTRAKKAKEEDEEAPVFGLINEDETKWLKAWRSDNGRIKIASTWTEEEAKQFESEEAAANYWKQAKRLGAKSIWRVVRLN